jgi:hypothetical protein
MEEFLKSKQPLQKNFTESGNRQISNAVSSLLVVYRMALIVINDNGHYKEQITQKALQKYLKKILYFLLRCTIILFCFKISPPKAVSHALTDSHSKGVDYLLYIRPTP